MENVVLRSGIFFSTLEVLISPRLLDQTGRVIDGAIFLLGDAGDALINIVPVLASCADILFLSRGASSRCCILVGHVQEDGLHAPPMGL